MAEYEYKVVPAPAKGRKAPGVKGAEARFAHGLEAVMNEMASEGWEYMRADVLPSEERQGLASTQTVYRSVLVFRRERSGARHEQPAAPSIPAPASPPPQEQETPRGTPNEVPDDTPLEIPREDDTAPSFRRRTPPPLTATRGAALKMVEGEEPGSDAPAEPSATVEEGVATVREGAVPGTREAPESEPGPGDETEGEETRGEDTPRG